MYRSPATLIMLCQSLTFLSGTSIYCSKAHTSPCAQALMYSCIHMLSQSKEQRPNDVGLTLQFPLVSTMILMIRGYYTTKTSVENFHEEGPLTHTRTMLHDEKLSRYKRNARKRFRGKNAYVHSAPDFSMFLIEEE